jgi:hypothetical protein
MHQAGIRATSEQRDQGANRPVARLAGYVATCSCGWEGRPHLTAGTFRRRRGAAGDPMTGAQRDVLEHMKATRTEAGS